MFSYIRTYPNNQTGGSIGSVLSRSSQLPLCVHNLHTTFFNTGVLKEGRHSVAHTKFSVCVYVCMNKYEF